MLKSALIFCLSLLLVCRSHAEDKKPSPPRIIAKEPGTLVAGFNGILKLRGFQLKGTQQFAFTDAPNIKVEVKDKKDAGDLQGFDKNDIGDSQVEIQLTIPSDQPTATLTFTVQTETGTTPPMKIEVLASQQFVDEKEPNEGFRNAQPLDTGRVVRGNIQQDKDVDVYQFTGKSGEKIRAEIIAARAHSLMDGLLALYDSKNAVLAQEDDAADSRDPMIQFTLPGDGTYFLVVTDAHDRGGEWHSYQLLLQTAP